MPDAESSQSRTRSIHATLRLVLSFIVISLLALGPAGAGTAVAACSAAAPGDTRSIVWRAGVNASWSAPEAASGGVSIITGNDIAVDATTAFAKVKFTADADARQDSGSFEYLKFAVRAGNSASINKKISTYVIGDESGDTFITRCVVTLNEQWTTVQISLRGLGVSPGATFEQLRFRNDSGSNIQFKLNNISFGGAAPDTPEPENPNPGPDLTPRPAQPISRCTASAAGDIVSTAWANGSSSQWQQPQPLGGGVTLSTPNAIEVNSTTAYGKIKVQAQRPVTGVRWIQFDVLSLQTPSADPAVEAYIYSTELGDTYASRCRAPAGSQWRRYRIPLSAFGGGDSSPVNQIRFRNGTNASMKFAINNIVLGGEQRTDPEDPVDPEDPPTPPQSRLPGPDRLVNWSTSVGADPVADRNLTLLTMSPPPNGVDASVEINRKLNSANNVLLRLSAGNYTLRNTIRLNGRNKILRGAGGGRTVLTFNGIEGSAIQIGSGYSPAADVRIITGVKGTRRLVLDTTPAIAARFKNQVIEIDKLRSTIAMDEPAQNRYYTRGGSDRWPGQLNRVASVSGNVLNLTSPLVLDYRAGELSPATRMLPQGGYNIGVENLVLRGTNLSKLNSAIFAKGVTNIWVKNIVSRRMARKSHIELVAVYRCSIQRNVLDDALVHSDGGQGYGVNLQRHSTGCLIEDNIFHRLRHSMIINLGAAGNALMYNYSTEPVHPNFEKGGPADISFHGNYTSGNLVEGNVIQRISMTDDCCKASPFNTVVRNCLLSSPLTLNFGSDSQNLVANAMYGSDSLLNRTLIDGGPTGRDGGKPALETGQGPLFDTTEGKDGLFVHADNPATRYNERSLDLIEYGNFHNGRFWYDQQAAEAPQNVPESYFYVNALAQRRSIFPAAPAAILTSPTGNEAADCDIPARRRAPAYIQ